MTTKKGGRPKGKKDSKPRKKRKKTIRKKPVKKIDEPPVETRQTVSPLNPEFENILEEASGEQKSLPSSGSSKPADQVSEFNGLIKPNDIAEWIGWPFLLWANVNDLAELQLSEDEKLSLAEPLCNIANRHKIGEVVNPDILDGITTAGRLTPIMLKRFALVKAERQKRIAEQGSSEKPVEDQADQG